MKTVFIVIIILILILLIPIPIKFSVSFNNKEKYIKIFSYNIIRKSLKKNNSKHNVSSKIKKDDSNKKRKKNFNFKYSKLVPSFYLKLRRIKYKPSISLKGFINYSLGDPANTAISFGTIHSIIPFFYNELRHLLKIKNFFLPINPIFNGDPSISLNIKGIFFISIGNIINILVILLKVGFKYKEVGSNEQ